MESHDKPHSDESYSDSDEEKDKSLFSVYKPGHIPGVYKFQTNEETALDNVESGSEIFGRSMVIVDKEDAKGPSLRGRQPPPVPPKPVMNKTPSQFQPEPSLHDTAPPLVPPRPAADKDNVHTDVDQSLEAPKPVPRRRKLQTGGEAPPRGDSLLPSEDFLLRETTPTPPPRLDRKRSSSSPEHEPTEEDDSEILAKRKKDGTETLTDEDSKASNDSENNDGNDDTVDFGPAESEKDQDIEEKTFIIHSLPKTFEMTEGDISKEISDSLETKDVTETKEDECETETETEKEKQSTLQDSNPEDEETKQYKNNFQESDSSKSDSDGDTSSNYGTPRSRSQSDAEDEEQEADTGQQTEEKEDVKFRTSEEDPEKDTVTFGSKSLKTTLSSRFGDSFEMIESESGLECFDSLSKATSNNSYQSRTESDIAKDVTSKRVSVKDMTSLFENVASGNSDKTSTEKDENDASFEVLSINKSATSYRTEVTQVETSLDGKDEDVSATSGKIDAPLTEDETNGNRFQNVGDADGEEKAKDKHESDAVNLLAEGTSDDGRSDIPPPVEPKSLQVLESMKMMTMEDHTPPAVPIKSLPPEMEQYEYPPISREGTYTPREAWTNMMGPYSFQSGQECMTQAPRREDEMQYPGAQGASGQSTLYQYPSYGQYPPFFVGNYQQQQQQQSEQQQQQPQQFPPSSQPYYAYCDQYGNPQYPYAYNPQMYPGMYYQPPDGQYYQQPYWCAPRAMSQQAQYSSSSTSVKQSVNQYGMPDGTRQPHQQPAENEYEEIMTPDQYTEKVTASPHTASLGQDAEIVQDLLQRTPPEQPAYTAHGYPGSNSKDQQMDRAQTTPSSRRDQHDVSKHGRSSTSSPRRPHKPGRSESPDDGYVKIADIDASNKGLKGSKSDQTLQHHGASPKYRRTQSTVLSSKKTAREKPVPQKRPEPKRDSRQAQERKTFVEREKTPKEEEEHYIYFKGINPKTNKENLANFVEIMTGGDRDVDAGRIIFNQQRDCALVVAAGKPDLEKGRKRIKEKGLEDAHPEMFEVETPTCIAVSCEEEFRNAEGLEYYFESKRAGGGEVKDEPYESEDGSCYILEFTEAAAVKRICEREKPHMYDGKTLRVSPYYKSKDGPIWDSALHVVKIPEPVVVPLEADQKHFLEKYCSEKLFDRLKEKFCCGSFQDDGLKLECTITPEMRNVKKLSKNWESEARDTLQDYIQNNVFEDTVNVFGENHEKVWPEIQEFVQDGNMANDCLVFSLNQELFSVHLVGFKDAVELHRVKLVSKQEEVRKRLRIQSKSAKTDPLKARLLESIGVFRESVPEDLKVHVSGGEITVTGQPADVNAILERVYATLDRFDTCTLQHGFSPEFVFFIKTKLTMKLSRILKNSGYEVEWDILEKEVHFCIYAKTLDAMACDEDDVYAQIDETRFEHKDKVKSLFQCSLYEVKEVVEKEAVEVLQSQVWLSKLEHITEKFETSAEVEYKQFEKQLVVYGLEKEAKEVHKMVLEFLDEHVMKQDSLRANEIKVRFIHTFRKDSLQEIEQKLASCKVNLWPEGDKIRVTGNKAGIQQAKSSLTKLLDTVISDKHTIRKMGVNKVFMDQREQGFIDILEKGTECLIQATGEAELARGRTSIQDFELGEEDVYQRPSKSDEAAGFKPTYKQPQRKKDFQAQNGVRIKLIKGEIGKQDGDVIMVTTSPNLNLSSGAACKSVLREGGQELQNECKELYQNDIKMGEIAVLHGHGTLECNRVYLTALPGMSSEIDPKQVVHKVMTDSLEMASKHNKRSILYCAMGTGQLRYPVDLVAMTMYQAVIEFDQKHPKTTLKDVKFILYPKDFSTLKAFEEEEALRIEGGGQRTTLELKKGSITIELSVENIAQQKVDAILCSTAHNMDLSRSGACQALLRSGGQSLQDECKTKYNNKLEDGQVVEIGGGKLHCKSVFLTVIPSYSAEAVATLKKVIEAFLTLANAKGFTSVALPALGTGFLKYPPEEVCKCMFETVSDWGAKNKSSKLKCVRFIMHAKDHKVIEKFRSHIMTAQGRGARPGRSGDGKKFVQGKATGSKAQPKRSSNFNAHEKGISIEDIKLSVLLGDILAQDTDAIVSSVGNDFKFVGAVAHELKTRCPGIEAECQSPAKLQEFQQEGVLITSSFGLSVKSVIHVRFANSIDEWQKLIKKCLEVAEKRGLGAVSFPVLGTGKGFKSYSPDAMAGCFFDAVAEFASPKGKRCLKDVRLVVYTGQPLMYNVIMEKLHKKVKEAATTKGNSWAITRGIKKFGKKALRTAQAFLSPEPGLMTAEERQLYQADIDQLSSVELTIYSDKKVNIERCKKEMDTTLAKAYSQRKIENYKEVVKTLTPEESKELDIVALANIKIDNKAGVISVDGPTKPVADVIHHLQGKLLHIERARHQKASAEELYKIAQWNYEEITETEFKETPYEKQLNYRIEQAYKNHDTTFEFVDDNEGEAFVIDFNQLIEYRKSDPGDTLKVIRKDILKAALSKLPDSWAQMKDNENIKVVSLQSTDKEYKDLETRFVQEVKSGSYSHRYTFNVNNLQVNKIERIQNKTLYQQYMAKKKQMTEQKPNLPANMPIERDLWHGTKYDAVTSITMHGFNRSYSGNANGEPWFGQGVYFAGDASYSARGWLSGAGAGSKGYMFLVKALTGQFMKGQKGLRYLPAVDARNPTVLYDCAVDDVAKPLEFVIFNDTQAYPAYIVTFTT